jgi:HK97 family phage major capsid protein
MIISCYPMDTDLTGIVNSMTISRGAVEFMTDHYVGQDAYFKCETDCAPKPTMMEPNPGTLNIAVHELSADECITNTMLEDALINMEGWLAQKVGGKFIRRINNGILHGAGINGVGQGMMDGITNTNNHLTMMSGMVSGTPAGHFSWQDLMAMSIKLDPRFQANALWLLGTNVMVNLMTMSDANGLPLFHQQVINGAGMPRLMGKPFVQVQQMPDYLNPDGTKKIGSKPIALGDWKSNYMLVHRRGFTMNRDPYSMMNCGVRYHFSQRIGGGVLCRNAAIFMQIK